MTRREWWKPIEGYEGLYEISNHGRIKSLNPKCYGRIMQLDDDRSEYLVIRLVKHTIRTKHAVHILVFTHFKNEPLLPGDIVHHIDENKHNNGDWNLMRVTVAQHRALHNRGEVKPILISNPLNI